MSSGTDLFISTKFGDLERMIWRMQSCFKLNLVKEKEKRRKYWD